MVAKSSTANPIIRYFSLIRKELLKAHNYYTALEENIGPNEEWRITTKTPLQIDFGGILSQDYVNPTTIIARSLSVVEEVISSLSCFSASEWKAFILGLTFSDFPIVYWGREEFLLFEERLEKAYRTYVRIESDVPTDERWRLKKKDPFSLSTMRDFLVAQEKLPTEILAEAIEFTKVISKILFE